MHVWLVKLEEPLPTDLGYRPYRMAMLADVLVQKGHSVTRWCSDFNHQRGVPRHGCRKRITFNDHYAAELLSSGIQYKKATSLLRLLDNNLLYRQFLREAQIHKGKPDLIVCSMPTPEMAYASAKIADLLNVPLVLDARDMWPDIIESELSGIKRVLAMPIIWLMKQKLTYAATKSSSLIGITEFYRDHLLRYAKRGKSSLDAVFSLGYDPYQKKSKASDDDLARYWRELGVDTGGTKKIVYFAGRLNNTVFNAIDPVAGAAKELGKKGENILFVICGTGTRSAEITSKFAGLNNVVFPGEIGAVELAFLRKRSFTAILPIEPRLDYLNSLSNKFFEYLSSSLPVLSWLDGLPGRILKETKCGFVYHSSEELVTKIVRLLNDPKLVDSMRVNALNLFNQRYRSDVVYVRFVEHLENVAEAFAQK
jgi:glycosyltransferase involved in cell wall biosynthesis